MTATEVSGDVRFGGWRWGSAAQPYLYEINTWPWLHQLSVEAGRPVDLSPSRTSGGPRSPTPVSMPCG